MTPQRAQALDVLMVEDDPVHRQLIRAMLAESKRENFDVRGAASLAEAALRHSARVPDVVLLDLGLPDGSTLSETMHTVLSWTPRPCVVVISNQTASVAALDCIRLGAEEFMSKTTLTSWELERTLRFAIERHASRIRAERDDADMRRRAARFTHNMQTLAHDLRSPMSAVKGFGDLLGDTSTLTDDDVRAIAEAMRRMGADALAMTEAMMQALSTDPDLALTATTMRHLVDRASVQQEATLIRAGATITVDCSVDVDLHVDTIAMTQVITNLLANAVVHGGTRVVVSCATTRRGVRLHVDDDGPGVPPDQREHIFGMGVTTHPDGTGYGLALSRSTVQRHGGRLWVEEAPTGGARFVVELPARTHRPSDADASVLAASRGAALGPPDEVEEAAAVLEAALGSHAPIDHHVG